MQLSGHTAIPQRQKCYRGSLRHMRDNIPRQQGADFHTNYIAYESSLVWFEASIGRFLNTVV